MKNYQCKKCGTHITSDKTPSVFNPKTHLQFLIVLVVDIINGLIWVKLGQTIISVKNVDFF